MAGGVCVLGGPATLPLVAAAVWCQWRGEDAYVASVGMLQTHSVCVCAPSGSHTNTFTVDDTSFPPTEFYTELNILTFLYHPSSGFSPHFVRVSSR